MEKILIINAHQRYENFAEGKLNQSYVDFAAKELRENGYEVKTTLVDKGYDVAEELEKHLWADTVIIQTPVYWMSVPYIYKQYIDTVYTTGVGQIWRDDGRSRDDASKKYGSGGLMPGKKYMLSITWNAPLEVFDDVEQFFEGKGVDDVFLWLHKIYGFFGMETLPTFASHDVMKNPDIENDMIRFKKHLQEAFQLEEAFAAAAGA